jgi:hypothetical protein
VNGSGIHVPALLMDDIAGAGALNIFEVHATQRSSTTAHRAGKGQSPACRPSSKPDQP